MLDMIYRYDSIYSYITAIKTFDLKHQCDRTKWFVLTIIIKIITILFSLFVIRLIIPMNRVATFYIEKITLYTVNNLTPKFPTNNIG
jgi:hypothetical protein